MQASKVNRVDKLLSGDGWFVTLENGLGRYVNPANPPYIGQVVTCANFGAGLTAEWIFH